MEIDRLIRQTAVGGFIVAGGVVLSQTGASASEAPASATGEATTPAPLKRRVIAASTPASQPAPAAATPARPAKAAAAKGAATPKRTAAAARRQAAAKPATTKPAAAKPATPTAAKPSPAAPGKATTAVTAGPDPVPAVSAPVVAGAGTGTLPVAPLDALDAPAASQASTPPVSLDASALANPTVPSRPGDGGAVAAPALAGLPLAAESTSTPETGLGQTVAAGDPPADLQGRASAAANPAVVSTAGQAQSAALTGTSPSGQVTVTIDQPRPGTVVAPGRPVLVTGTVTVGGGSGPINVIYVLDVSGSTSGTGGACGDPNGDGDPDTILDCEVAALTALNGSLSSSTVNVNVSLVTFSSGASTADLSPAVGLQATTRPSTDASGNGVPDVVDVLRSQSPGGGTEFDAALSQVRGLLVAGAQNLVFFLSDGQSSLSTGPGSDLQAIAGAGARVLTYAVGTGTSGCAAGQPLAAIAAATGGTCTEVTDPSRLGVAITAAGIGGIGRVQIEVNGFAVPATVDPLGGFSALIPADLLRPGRNDLFAVAFGGGQVAIADTFVVVGNRLVFGDDLEDGDLVGDDDVDGFLVAHLDGDERRVEAASLGEVTGLLPATGSGPGHLAATGALSFLLGGLLVGGGKHLRRRRRAGAPA